MKYHSVCVCSYGGEFLHKFGKEGDKKGDFIGPFDITICRQGRNLQLLLTIPIILSIYSDITRD